MPIYLARAPSWGAIIRAEDREEAIYILDQVAEPSQCEIEEYDGPLVFEFSLPVLLTGDPRGGENLVVPETPLPLDLRRLPHFEVFEGESGTQMRESILEQGFPALSELRKAWSDDPDRDDECWGMVESAADERALGVALANQLRWWETEPEQQEARLAAERDHRRVRDRRARLLAEQILEYVSCGGLKGARDAAMALVEQIDEDEAEAMEPRRAEERG